MEQQVETSSPLNKPAAGGRRSLSRRILSGSVWMLVGRLGSMGSLFLMQVVLFRCLGNDYAAYLTASSVVPLLSMLATVGVPWTLIRILRSDVGDPEEKRRVVHVTILLTAIGSIVSSAIFLLSVRLLPAEPKWQVLHDYPWMVAAWFSMSALCMVAASYLQAEDNFLAAALVGARSGGVIPNVISLLLVAMAASGGLLYLHRALSFQLLAYLIAVAASVGYIRRGLPRRQRLAAHAPTKTGGTPRTVAWFFSESWPNLLNQLIAVALNEVDLMWVAFWASEDTIASYGAVRNLRLLVSAPLMVASIALPPFVAELYGKRDLTRLERLLRGSATALAIPSLAALGVLLIAPEFTLHLIYGESLANAGGALQLIAIGSIVFVLSGSNSMTLTMTGRHRDLLFCSLCSLFLYVVISVPLVRHYGVVGAALSLAIQTIVQNVAATIRVRQTIGLWTIPFASWSAARSELLLLVNRLKPARPKVPER